MLRAFCCPRVPSGAFCCVPLANARQQGRYREEKEIYHIRCVSCGRQRAVSLAAPVIAKTERNTLRDSLFDGPDLQIKCASRCRFRVCNAGICGSSCRRCGGCESNRWIKYCTRWRRRNERTRFGSDKRMHECITSTPVVNARGARETAEHACFKELILTLAVAAAAVTLSEATSSLSTPVVRAQRAGTRRTVQEQSHSKYRRILLQCSPTEYSTI
jgi:hypothetical protein